MQIACLQLHFAQVGAFRLPELLSRAQWRREQRVCWQRVDRNYKYYIRFMYQRYVASATGKYLVYPLS